MKNVFFIFAGILMISASAQAQESQAESVDHCVKAMLGNPKMTQSKAAYACNNMWLEERDSDSKEQDAMRRELVQEANDAKSEHLRQYEVDQND